MFTSVANLGDKVNTGKDLRRQNESRLLTCLRQDGPLSRAELAKRLDLTTMAIGRIIASLLSRNIVEEKYSENGPTRPGRPGLLVSLREDWLGIGIDSRVHKTEIVCVDIRGFERYRAPLRVSRDELAEPDNYVDAIAKAVDELRVRFNQPIAGLGVGVAGLLDSCRRNVIFSQYLGWNTYPLADRLEEATSLPVALRHLPECAALAHSIQEPFSPQDSVMHVHLGVGLGMAISSEQDLAQTRPIGKGEPGHALLGDPEKLCVCGRHGCADTVLGFDAFMRRAKENDLNFPSAAMTEAALEVSRLAEKGEPWAVESIEELKVNLARIISVFATIEMPDHITLGGYPTVLGNDFFDEVSKLVSEQLLIESPLVQTRLGDCASGYGAALLGVSQIVRHEEDKNIAN